MVSIKKKIVSKLDFLPKSLLQQILDLIESKSISVNQDLEDKEDDILWVEKDLSSLNQYDPYEWKKDELEQGSPITIDSKTGIVIVEE